MKNSKRTIMLTIGIIMLMFIYMDMQAAPSFKVEIAGKGKQTMILIPGLSCPGDVWKETVAHYQQHYTCHVISLPGFAGTPTIATEAYLQTMRDELVQYIKDQKLKKPILVGHSLGGFLALWISATYPDLVGKNIIVDSMPFLSATQNPNATVESSKSMAENIRKMIANATPAQTKESQKYYLPTMVINPEKLQVISQWGIDSDSKTVGQAMYELQTTDLRETIASIKCPTLVLAAWIAYKDQGYTKEKIQKVYDMQYEKLPNKTIVMSDQGKHFLMYDDLDWMLASVDSFLSKK